jgi:hypothetical protein
MRDIELNEWIHKNVMEGEQHNIVVFRHEVYNGDIRVPAEYICTKCGQRRISIDWTYACFAMPQPYCSDLNAIAKVEAKVIEKESYQRYGLTLSIIVDKAQPGLVWEKVRYGLIATATARQRAEACKIVWNWQAEG